MARTIRVTAQVVRKLRPLFCARGITKEVSTTSTDPVVIVDSDVLIDPSIFQISAKLYIRFIAQLRNVGGGINWTQARLYRQHAGTAVSGTEVSTTSTEYAVVDSGWVDITGESGLESYQVQLWVLDSNYAGYCNSTIMLLCGLPF